MKKLNKYKIFLNELNVQKETKELLLFTIGRNLNELAKKSKFDPIIGRDDEIEDMINILARRRKNNPVLIGEAGVGKTAIVEHLATMIVNGDVPETLKDKTIVEIDVGGIMAGTSTPGEVVMRVKKILSELEENVNIIVFIDEIHMVLEVQMGVNLGDLFKPALARGNMRCIGATTPVEFKVIEDDKALDRRFQKVRVDEPTIEESVEILNRLKEVYGEYHGVTYTDDAVLKCVQLSSKYITDRFLPDKAIDLMDEVGARFRVKKTKSEEVKELEIQLHKIREEKNQLIKSQKYPEAQALVTSENGLKERLAELNKNVEKITINGTDIINLMKRKLDIPELDTDENSFAKYVNLESTLKASVVGQDVAINKIGKLLKRSATGLKDPNKPNGVFMLMGTTGTGKTHLVKQLAKALYGSESDVIRLDMSEYSEKHTVSKLIGSPPGYVGYGKGGDLTERVKKKPNSIILLDEIEKANPIVLNTFLQVFDDGRLTDGQGNTIDFKHTTIFMTSNIGAGTLAKIQKNIDNPRTPVGYKYKDDIKDDDIEELEPKSQSNDLVKAELNKYMSPEFINRIDEVIVFAPLSRDNIYRIVDVELNTVREKLKSRNLTLTVSDSLKKFLSEEGYNPRFGARPLKRTIVKYIEGPISEEIIRGQLTGEIKMDYKNGKVTINENPIIERAVYNWKTFNIFKG